MKSQTTTEVVEKEGQKMASNTYIINGSIRVRTHSPEAAERLAWELHGIQARTVVLDPTEAAATTRSSRPYQYDIARRYAEAIRRF